MSGTTSTRTPRSLQARLLMTVLTLVVVAWAAAAAGNEPDRARAAAIIIGSSLSGMEIQRPNAGVVEQSTRLF